MYFRKWLIAITAAAIFLVPSMSQARTELYTQNVLKSQHEVPNSRLSSIAYSGEFYLYFNSMGELYKSSDGLKWEEIREYRLERDNQIIDLMGAFVSGMIYDGKQFVAVMFDDIVTSKDGKMWKTVITSEPADSTKEYDFEDILYANGQYVLVGQVNDRQKSGFYIPGPNVILTSNDLVKFEEATLSNVEKSFAGERPLDHLAWGGNRFFAGGNTSAISLDGKTWEGIEFSGGWNAIWDGERFLSARMDFIASPTDDTYAVELPSGESSNLYLNVIGFNGKEYIAAGYRQDSSEKDTTLFYSTNGKNWEPMTMKGWDTDVEAVFPTSFGFILTGNNVWAVSKHPFDKPSAWAEESLAKARQNGFVADSLLGFHQADLTRAQASQLVVRLYEKLTGTVAGQASVDTFKDTTLADVLKANKLGIVSGKENGFFWPEERVTRQDFAVMIDRTLKAANNDKLTAASDWKEAFVDLADIAPYAKEALHRLNSNGIMNGVGNSHLAPRGNTTREEAIVLVERLYELIHQ